MSKANISILLVILAVAIVGGVYLYVYKPNMEEKDTIQAEINTLQAKYDDLAAKAQKKDQYLADTAMYRAGFEDEVAYFPATLDQEISVMFIKGINKDEGVKQFDVSNVGLGRPNLFYVLGSGATQGNSNVTYTEDSYLCYSAEFPVAYTGSYEGIKDLIDYVMAYKYRMNVSSVTMSYNSETDMFTGNVSLNAYCIAGADREADKISVNVNNGVENIFHGGAGAVAVSSFEYDADNGAAIVSNHDVNILLNNANNDTSDGIIVSAGGSDTYVTSGANNVETLVITVDSEEGKNFVTYAIGDKSYKKEIVSTDLKIYVESSKRVDGNDNNGVKVTVDNKTSLPVFFKVVDDDTTSPRFSVGSKSGTVKVY
ncbi:MAG: hypothetical protein NC240_00915 [Clostridium sp.]|nr:hypothetical protein [Clostridium sp.]